MKKHQFNLFYGIVFLALTLACGMVVYPASKVEYGQISWENRLGVAFFALMGILFLIEAGEKLYKGFKGWYFVEMNSFDDRLPYINNLKP